MQVYIAKDGRQEGPYTVEYINSQAAAGRIKPTDMAWMQGWPGWQPLSMVPGFLSASPPPPPPPGTPPPPSPPPLPGSSVLSGSAEHETLLRLFVGKNYEYYSRKWAEAEQKPNKNTWNWAAFFLSLWWTAYRKMYRYAGILFGVVVAETICQSAFGLPDGVSAAISIGIAIAYGLQGNRWYRLHAEQKLGELAPAGASDEATRARIARAGGTSAGAVLAFSVALFVVLFAIGFITAIGKMHRDTPESSKPAPQSSPERTAAKSAKPVSEAASRTDWMIPPTLPGAWVTLSAPEQDLEISRLAKSQEGQDLTARNEIIRIRTLPLSFYDGVDLCEAEVRPHNLHGVRVYLRQGSHTVPLDGTSNVIQRFKAANSIQLENASQATSYLRFFCGCIQAEQGVFRIIDTIEDVHWSEPTNDAERADLATKRANLGDKIVPLRVSHLSSGEWTGTGTVAYSNSVFRTTLKLDPSGNVEMTDDQPLAADLPVHIEAFFDGIRAIQHQ